jgi:hypothetical protein
MYILLKTLHPGGIRTLDLLFFRRSVENFLEAVWMLFSIFVSETFSRPGGMVVVASASSKDNPGSIPEGVRFKYIAVLLPKLNNHCRCV